MPKIRLLASWIWDQFLYPVWEAIFPPKDTSENGGEDGAT